MAEFPLPLRGTYGEEGIVQAARVKESGCDALWFHGFREDGFAACDRYGLAPCVEFRTFRADYDARPELIPLDGMGEPIRRKTHLQGVCLSKTDFVESRFEELERELKTFSPVGVWLDYLTYGGWFESDEPDLQDNCFCPDCRGEFCESENLDALTAEEILLHHKEAWTSHKVKRLAALGYRFSALVKESDPKCLVGAYMCPWTPEEFEGGMRTVFGQDYAVFSDFIDIFTPLLYAGKCGKADSWCRPYLKDASRFIPRGKPVMPILDALDFPGCLEAYAESASRSAGFQIFAGGNLLANGESRKKFYEIMEKIRKRDLSSGF